MMSYQKIIRPLLFQMDPEQAHVLVHSILKSYGKILAKTSGGLVYNGSDLSCELFGRPLANPIGLAAGFDKNGELTEVLGALGFGFAEIGSVCARATNGNPKPRLFRLPEDEAAINRLGLNGHGADAVAERLGDAHFSLPIGLNIAKTNDPAIVGEAAVADMIYTFNKIRGLPITYVTVNASCPNTKEGIVTEGDQMRLLMQELQKFNSTKIPILIKLSPDSTTEFIEFIVDAAGTYKIAGFVCGNTTTTRDGLKTSPQRIKEIGMGGLSGAPLKEKAIKLCQSVNAKKKDWQIIIGCGGISTGKDAYDFMTAGASLLEVYTGLVYRGPTLPLDICRELSAILKQKSLDKSNDKSRSKQVAYTQD